MSSPLDRTLGQGSPSARVSEHGSPLSERRDSPLSDRLDSLSGERRCLVRTEKRIKGQQCQSASVVVGSVRIKAEFDDFSYGDTCSVSPKVLAERKKYRGDGNPDSIGANIKQEPAETGMLFGDDEQSPPNLPSPVASSAYQLSPLAGHDSIGNFGMWSHKKFGIGGFVQYGSSGNRSSTQSDSPGSKSFYPREPSGSVRGGTSVDGSPDSGNSTESRKSFPYGSPKMVVKSEKSPSPKCDPVLAKSTPVLQSPLTPEQLLSHSWLHMNRSKTDSPEERSPVEVAMSYRRESTVGLNSRHSQDFELTSIYPCKFCHEAFSLYTALQEHIRLEHSDDVVVNSRTVDYGKAYQKAKSHQDARSSSSYSEGPDGKYICKFCSLGFEFYTVLQEHIRIAHDGGRRSSVASNASVKVPCSVSPVVVDGPSKYPCKHCDDSFPLYTALQEHIRIEHGENAYWGRAAYMSMMIDGREEFLEEIMNRCDCQFCPEKFTSPLLLQEHVRVEHVPKWAAQKKAMAHTLPVTSANNDPPPVLQVHNSPKEEPVNQDTVKNLLKKYVCAVCGKEYANKIRYQVHIKSHNKQRLEEKVEPKLEPPPKPSESVVPIPQFSTNQDTKSVNVEDLRYVCEVCNARFPLYVVMQEHIRTAHGEKPFKCDLCEKEFIKRNYLMKHMKAHAEAKAQVLKCHKCDRCFMDQARLQEHAKEHTNEGRYKCHVCGSCFTHKMHHDQHVRTHSGEKPYKCGECSKQFSQPGPFHNHLRSHARCAYCNRTFLEKAALLLHLKMEHGQKVTEDTNHTSPVSGGSVVSNPTSAATSSLLPVSMRLPDPEYLAPSPNEPLNLSKNSKGSPLRVTPVPVPTGSHLMSPVMFPGMELYADLMSSLSGGAAMSVASSNSNNSLNDLSRPNSAKSDTMSEIRLKSDLRDPRRSPSLAKEREVAKFMKESLQAQSHALERTLDGSRERSDLNGSDKGHQGPLSVDFLSTSSGFSSPSSKSADIKQALISKSSLTQINSSLKCNLFDSHMAKSRESVEKYWQKTPQLENMFTRAVPPEHIMYSALMHPELFRNSLSPFTDPLTQRPPSAGMKRTSSNERVMTPLYDRRSSPPSKVMKLENQEDDNDINVDTSSEEDSSIATTCNGRDKTNLIGNMAVESDQIVKLNEDLDGSPKHGSRPNLDWCSSFICGICTELFQTQSDLVEHHCCGNKILEGHENSFADRQSNVCRDESLGASSRIAPQRPVYRCKCCSKLFWEKSLLLAHLESVEESTKMNDAKSKRGQHFNCDLCGNSYSSAEKLFHHLGQHDNIRHHGCPICGRQFVLVRHLLVHVASHATEYSHLCQECGVSFRLQTSLLEHRKLHNEGNCVCHSCGKSFGTKQHLQMHMKIHETEDKTGSSVLDEKQNDFRQHNNAKIRQERPFQCAKCHERFGAMAALVDHVENKLCKPSVCAICEKAFLKKSQLKCHLKTHKRFVKDGEECSGKSSGGSWKHSHSLKDASENDRSETAGKMDNSDIFDNRELTPENATSMTANSLALPFKGGAGVEATEGQLRNKRD